MQTLFNRLSLASGIYLALAIVLDFITAGSVMAPGAGVTAAAFSLWVSAFFGLLVPGAVLYVIIKLAVRHAK